MKFTKYQIPELVSPFNAKYVMIHGTSHVIARPVWLTSAVVVGHYYDGIYAYALKTKDIPVIQLSGSNKDKLSKAISVRPVSASFRTLSLILNIIAISTIILSLLVVFILAIQMPSHFFI